MAEVAVVEIVAFRDCRRDHDLRRRPWVLLVGVLAPLALGLFVIAEAAGGRCLHRLQRR